MGCAAAAHCTACSAALVVVLRRELAALAQLQPALPQACREHVACSSAVAPPVHPVAKEAEVQAASRPVSTLEQRSGKRPDEVSQELAVGALQRYAQVDLDADVEQLVLRPSSRVVEHYVETQGP